LPSATLPPAFPSREWATKTPLFAVPGNSWTSTMRSESLSTIWHV
jgi:hypothetical protein